MINLLPTDYKRTLLFARRNTSLRGWIITLVIVLVGTVVVVGIGYWYLKNETNKQVAALERSKQELQQQNIDGVRTQIDEISGNTRLVIEVLQREILFSKLIRSIGAALPPNTILTGITLDDKVEGGIDLTAAASDFTSASQIQVNLQDPDNKVFAKADIVSITCGGTEIDGYPCNAQIRALFNEENPYAYIPADGANSGGGQ